LSMVDTACAGRRLSLGVRAVHAKPTSRPVPYIAAPAELPRALATAFRLALRRPKLAPPPELQAKCQSSPFRRARWSPEQGDATESTVVMNCTPATSPMRQGMNGVPPPQNPVVLFPLSEPSRFGARKHRLEKLRPPEAERRRAESVGHLPVVKQSPEYCHAMEIELSHPSSAAGRFWPPLLVPAIGE
jgi:hypothetical protein